MGLRDISLKWKLLVPFLLLSFTGTTTLVVIAFRSQHALIRLSEERILEGLYQQFIQSIQDKEEQAQSLAAMLASDPIVQDAFSRQDRRGLLDHLKLSYTVLRKQHGVRQIHFHNPPARSFLRVHRPAQYGEEMASYRRMIAQALKSRKGVGGLEWGNTGYGIRGVVPIEVDGEVLGSVEVGFSFERPFIDGFKARHQCDLSLYVPDRDGGEGLIVLASTFERPKALDIALFTDFEDRKEPLLWMPFPDNESISGLLGPVRDFSGRVVALVEISIGRGSILSLLGRSRTAMTVVELIGLLLATLVVWIVVHRFLLPIREMVKGAAEIVAGDRLHMPLRGSDELGQLARALNNMVGYLEASRQRMKDYAQDLEKEVQARTRELRQSEAKYRSLVDRVPLVVYQMTPRREMILVNQYAREMLGVESSVLLSEPMALDRLIHPEDRDRVQRGFSDAASAGREWINEYRIEHPEGRIIHVREHAIPLFNEKGEVIQVDGILVDSTDQKKLQEKTLQAEELKTLGEVSARLAHEIRNPLTSIGGLSRRLLKDLSDDHPARKWVLIVIKEVERLEGILRMIVSYIQPVELQLTPADLGGMMSALMTDLLVEFQSNARNLTWEIAPQLPRVCMDPGLLRKTLENLCRHTLFLMDEGETLQVRVDPENDLVRIRWRYRSSALSQEDLDHYFYPFLSQSAPDPALLDLPVSKIILHKHGGLVHVARGEKDEIVLDVRIPAIQEALDFRAPEVR
jgi:PAS domain S-box-containing protein